MKTPTNLYTEWLLFHLWKSRAPIVNVPQTILYSWGSPVFWYFTGSDGIVRRMAKSRIGNDKVAKELERREDEVLATYIGLTEAHAGVVEFLGKASLETLLYGREKSLKAILTQWVVPKTPYNCIFKVYWSPHFTYIEKRRNRHLLDDPNVGFYERLVTFEDLERHTITEPVTAANIVEELQNACSGIAASILKQTGGHVLVQSLVMIFKQDADDKFWLLYCLGIKVELSGDEPVTVHSYEELRLSVPDAIRTQEYDYAYPESQANYRNCASCLKFTPSKDFYGIESDYVQRNSSHLPPDLVDKLLRTACMNSFDSNKTSTKTKSLIEVCIDCYLLLTKPKSRQSKLAPPKPLQSSRKIQLPKISQSEASSPKIRTPTMSMTALRMPKLKLQLEPTHQPKSMSISVHSQSYFNDKVGLMTSAYKYSHTAVTSPLPSTGHSTPANRSPSEQFDFMLATIQKLKSLSLKDSFSYACREEARHLMLLAALQ